MSDKTINFIIKIYTESSRGNNKINTSVIYEIDNTCIILPNNIITKDNEIIFPNIINFVHT